MKKRFKCAVAAFAALFISSAAFASDFDWSECWCSFGGGIEKGDVIVNVGGGFSWDLLSVNPTDKNWFIPPVEASVEVPVMIWKLPFTFGGSAYYSASFKYYNNGEYKDLRDNIHNFAVASLAKYHFHFPPKNLDVYAGLKLGVGFKITGYDVLNNKGEKVYKTGFGPYFFNSEFIGATWYFTDALV